MRGVAMGARLARGGCVPSQLREVLVEMFRTRPELARELVIATGQADVAAGTCESASVDLAQAVPSEYRADAVTVVRDGDVVRAAIIVEVQLAADADKPWTWPVYVAALRARLRCDVMLLVMAPDSVAAWARRSISLGHPRFVLEPIVMAFSEVPRVTTVDEAERAPELALLSVLAHHDVATATAALVAVDRLPEDLGKLCLDLVLKAFPDALQAAIEGAMLNLKNYEWKSNFARRHIAYGRWEARDDMRRFAIELARSKAPDVEGILLERIEVIDDVPRLGELIAALGGARTRDEAVAVLEALPGFA